LQRGLEFGDALDAQVGLQGQLGHGDGVAFGLMRFNGMGGGDLRGSRSGKGE
jgi:hypothetical protein